ncbi:ATP-binding cassette domain-containing protein [Polymorphobacter sp.]|uniref:ATP-binding cassette domain-containing protein n=1 Tax=Polymorphobacter sp. TaxID=1909290 RepID=UPI003F6F0552
MSAMEPALVVDRLSIGTDEGVPLVHGISFNVARGEVLGIVGESGSGKSLSALAVAGLLPDGLAVTGGGINVAGEDVLGLPPQARRRLGGSKIGFVFQDPLSCLNPVRRIGTALVESAMRHRGLGTAEARSLALARLADMQLRDPERLIDSYPHQLSGGQRQRVMIALALVNDPPLLIADEPTTALDATVQRSILALLRRHAHARATILITHDLGVAVSLCDRIMVMHQGEVVETGEARALLSAPTMPYTQGLIAARLSLGDVEAVAP